MVTFTTLAESKCRLPLSRQARPIPGSSTATATAETRPRRAAWMPREILTGQQGYGDSSEQSARRPHAYPP